MATLSIDLSDEEDGFSVENPELTTISVVAGTVTLEMRWEQAEGLYRALKGFFEEES